MIRLALLRHGHTSWNREGRIQGRSDIPLEDEARSALAGLALPPPWDEATHVASPLARAAETLRLVAGREGQTSAALIEMNWGAWEGQKGVELLAQDGSGYRHIEDWGWDYTPPDGESPAALRARLLPWMESLTTDTVAVCHIGIMRVILALATGWDFAGPAPFRVKRNRLYILTLTPEGPVLDPDQPRLIERA